ncbi:adenylate/guanylate cyclase domain-containing protein [Frondihabitans sucicola]|uniref:Adenylate/guanylate cyclase domain-containing protein n=1 Tax=Frondihabitans sucicola TaxID=1268041 RepID=A0ABN6Y2X0_9MICO|nr:adenylate/guanylate cyclase domain-containing protein [Frondihabitans sucicola]BDZ51685.1 adenylate/guanylate cyclase domain-containing protein [Frondihabitans sucicola]
MSQESSDVVTSVPKRRFRWRAFLGRGSLDIQSKLLVMLLAVSILATLVIGAIGYVNGRNSLQDAAFQQVTNLRESRTSELKRTLQGIEQAVVLDSRNQSAIESTAAFTKGFDALQGTPVSADETTALSKYYSDSFAPALEKQSGETTDPKLFEPTTNPQAYLQTHYTVPYNGDYDEAIKTDDAGDGSAWSAAHAKFHDYYRELVYQLGYEDVLLLDTKGNVVYSAYSGVDLGTNVTTGPYSKSNLATVYNESLRSNSVDSAQVADYAAYQPSLDAPTAWVASPVGSGSSVLGVLAVQIPSATIDDVMTGNQGWKGDGLGDTGESYIAGPDKLMRSTSRELIQHPKQFEKDAVAAGTSTATAKREVATKSSILLQTVNTTAVDRGLKGQKGTAVDTDYLGHQALVAYAPLGLNGLNYVVVAKVDASEAFAPVDVFTRNLFLSMAAIIVVVTLLSLLLAQVFVRPVRKLQTAVNRVSAGEIGVEVETRSGDEFGDLGNSFNDMNRSLKLKQDLLDEQKAENDRLLLTLMPAEVARRYKEGEETIAEDHTDVSVSFADVVGFDEFARTKASGESLLLLNGLWKSFDDAAARLGVEKVRSTQRGYLASCGMTVPRVDNARRIVDFTLEQQAIVERFNGVNGTKLSLRAGIDSGVVTSGLIGRSSMVYDMWGDAVSLAYRVQGTGRVPGIYATQRVVDKLGDTVPFTEAGSVDTQSGSQQVFLIGGE